MDLTPFGLTRTQSRVLTALSGLKTASGFALARETGIARANVYDALDVLLKKELVTSTGSRPVQFSVGGPGQILDALSTAFQGALASLRAEIGVEKEGGTATGHSSPPPIHPLYGGQAVISSSIAALSSAKHEVLGVVGPWATELYDALEAARGRGLVERLLSLGEPAPQGARQRAVRQDDLRSYWGGLPVAVVVDRREAICAVVRDGAWTGVQAGDSVLVPFIRHLLRRELASAAAAPVS